jgi:regulator of protease activity HflC (stomatin/prohibitin superfamily)
MFSLFLGSLLVFAGLIAFVVRYSSQSAVTRASAASVALALILAGAGVFIFASAVSISSDQTGVVIRTLGGELPAGHIVAVAGEKGPQAKVLGPGWHFGYWPWSYEVEKVETVLVPNGQIGVVTAQDGKVLPGGTVFAPAWKSADDMLDATKFLAESTGYRGPQLTILTPGNYRINPRLFKIELRPVTLVAAGEVAVVKANAGEVYTGTDKITVNGVDIVPQGHRGIWHTPLTPGAYNLHPEAYQVIKVKTTQRVYTYQRVDRTAQANNTNKRGQNHVGADYSISVRSKDGFTFPVDVRLSLSVAAENTPYLVALLGDPDRVMKDEQEDEELEILEARLVLPTARAALRNVAETLGALEYVASRSRVETLTAKLVESEFHPYKLTFLGAFIGAIGLDSTDAGQKLLLTQTDKEVASNQRATYQQQQQAEVARQQFIRSREEADQQKQLVEAEFAVKTAGERAKAQIETAKGEGERIRITAEARKQSYDLLAAAIGKEGVTLLESLRLVQEGNIRITPDVLVQGGGGDGSGVNEALAATILRQQIQKPANK